MAIIFVDSTASGANDGTSWTDAYTSLNTALLAANIAPGDQVLVSGTFNETVAIAEAAAATTPNRIQGDDKSGGAGVGARATFTIDGQSTRANGMTAASNNIMYVIRDMRITGCTGDGFSGGGTDAIAFRDCRFDNNGGWGLSSDNDIMCIRCTFDNNVTGGLTVDLGAVCIDCQSHTNGNGVGIDVVAGSLINCLVYGNGTGDGIQCNAGASFAFVVYGCTLDGENSGVGIDDNSAGVGMRAYVNNVIYDWATGIDFANDHGELVAIENCLFNSNTTDVNGNIDVGIGENPQTGAPLFTDEAGDDYTLQSGSPAKAAGADAGDVVAGGTSYIDIGAHQRQEPAGGGGTTVPQSLHPIEAGVTA